MPAYAAVCRPLCMTGFAVLNSCTEQCWKSIRSPVLPYIGDHHKRKPMAVHTVLITTKGYENLAELADNAGK